MILTHSSLRASLPERAQEALVPLKAELSTSQSSQFHFSTAPIESRGLLLRNPSRELAVTFIFACFLRQGRFTQAKFVISAISLPQLRARGLCAKCLLPGSPLLDSSICSHDTFCSRCWGHSGGQIQGACTEGAHGLVGKTPVKQAIALKGEK